MIFLRCVFDGSFNNKVVQIWKSRILSLSLSTQKETRANKHHHHHQIMEVADIAIAPLKEFVRDSARLVKKMHETRPTRVYAHREQDGVRCVLSINIIIIIIIIALFFCVSSSPCLSIFLGEIKYIYIYIATLSRFGSRKNVLSPPPSKRDDEVYHVWVRRVLRETGLVSVSLRSLFTLDQQSPSIVRFWTRLNTQITGLFSPVAWAMRLNPARAKYLLTGVSFFLLTQHTE